MDLQELLLRFTFDNVCVAAFGVDPGCLALDLPEIPFAKAFEDATEYSLFRFLVPAVVWKIGSYRWDDKLLLALSAFATVFGEFWVIIQAQSQNPLAASIALLKQYPNSFSMFEPIRDIELQDETVSVVATKSSIYVAAYWIVRSIIACVSLITNLRSLQDEQVHLLAQNAEQKMHMKLVNAFQEPHFDNQDVLRLLFGQRNDLPLKHSSSLYNCDLLVVHASQARAPGNSANFTRRLDQIQEQNAEL